MSYLVKNDCDDIILIDVDTPLELIDRLSDISNDPITQVTIYSLTELKLKVELVEE